MEVEQIDALLDEWRERVARVDASLLALEADETFRTLSGAHAAGAPLDGDSASRIPRAIDAATRAFEARAELGTVVDRAVSLRADLPAVFGRREKLDQIESLLTGPSIERRREPTPLADRDLLDPVSSDVVRLTLDDALAAMTRDYALARDVVALVAHAWSALDARLSAFEDRLRPSHPARDARDPAHEREHEHEREREDVAALRSDLDRLRARVMTDPIGASDAHLWADLESRLNALLTRRAADARARDAAAHLFARCDAALALARAAYDDAERARRSVARDFADAVERLPRGSDDASVEGLVAWRAKLAEAAQKGRFSSVEIGLTRWLEAATVNTTADRSVADAALALAHRRDELAGHFAARRAQASALIARGARPPAALDAHAAKIDALLATRPTPLDALAASVDAFALRVTAMASNR